MAAKVVSISGANVPVPGTISDSLVDFLEESLEKALSGEIVGMAGAVVYPSENGYSGSAGSFSMGFSNSYASIGALEDAKFKILKDLDG